VSAVYITQARIISPLGGLEETWVGLLAGKSAAGPIARFNASRLACPVAATLPWLDRLEGRNSIQALLEPLLEGFERIPSDSLLVWTGIKGGVQDVEERAAGGAGQALSLARHYRLWIQSRLRLKGEGQELNAACVSSTAGLALAAARIAAGEAGSALVVGADVVSRFTFTGFSSLRALTSSACRPFHAQRDGLMLGDAACALQLCDGGTADRLGLPRLARLSGWGIANDANHITGPARDGRGLVLALRQALDQAGAAPDAIAGFCAHGTATAYNDAMELTALDAVFGQRRFPCFGSKGSLGHSLGAVGGLEAALCLKALAAGAVPGTWGCDQPEERALGRFMASTQPLGPGGLLTSNSGFGGLNAALLMERA
jgi:3-oxoacyl-[acyl-carrier-protein] synthase II